METENSRRPFVRSREPDLKKPRLSQELILAVDRSSNGRPSFMQRPATSGSAASRRVSDSVGDSYPLVQQQQQHQHLELVNEYKTALAELTFNSKPIITNLTIIAGENLDAAKAIAATICSNIIEVPSEQKLPSLYLLDSIVKNIGRDYIKYFGSKLPEVFCKAYRQVDPPVHTSMKHLFGTWKGVFPPQPLQAIEKELGFSAAANRLPVGTSRVDVPVSRPAHSIHVNPKYLEARQRLQQSSKAKAANSDPSENVVSSTVGHERMRLGSERPWVDSSTKQNSQYTQRELNNVSRTKNISVPVGESEYDSDINQSGFEISQGREKFTGNGKGTVLSTQRNGFDTKNGLPNYHLNSKRALNHGLTDQSTIQTTDHWKDSEEEEYMWDDINSRAGDRDDAANSVRDRWPLDDSEKTSEASIDYLSTEMKDQEVFGNRALSPWSQDSHLPERLGSVSGRTIPGLSERHTTYSTTNGRTSFQSKVARGSSIGSSVYGTSNSRTLGSSISVVPQRQTLGSSSPSAQSLLYPPGSSSFAGRGIHHNHTDHDMPHSGIALESKTDTDLCTKLGQEALALPSPDSKRIMSPNAPSSFSVTPNSRQHELESENLESDLTHEIPKQFSHALALTQHVTDANMPVSSLLSSLVAKGLISAAKTKSTTSNNTSQKLGLETTRSAVKTKSTTSNISQNLGLETTRSAVKTKSTTSNTSQNLGLETKRSAVKTKSTASNSSQNLGLETIFGSSKVSVPIVSLPKSSSSITSELSSDKPVSASTSLIGFHFKGDVLRVLHPSVISSLFDDFQHKCEVCEARLKIQDQVGRHMKWHNLRNQKNNSKKASRAWYAADFVNTLDESSGPQEGGQIKRLDCTELKVPADESQCLCVLCGELFEDYYDQGIAQWMFKGAVYATVPCSNVIGGIINEVVEQGSIVHEKCINKA